MEYSTAVLVMRKLDQFVKDLENIDVAKADEKRKGLYTIALKQLRQVLNGELEMEKVTCPNNILRTVIELAHLDKSDELINNMPLACQE